MNQIRKYLLFVVLLTLVYGVSFLLIDFFDTPVNSLKDVAMTTGKWGYMLVMTGLLLYFLSLNRYLFALFFPLLSVCCTALAYFKLTLHVELTQMVIDLAVVNDFRTSLDAITWQLVAAMLLVLAASVWAVVYRFRHVRVAWSWLQLLVCVGVLWFINNNFTLSLPLRHHTPYSIYYAIDGYIENRHIISEKRPPFSGTAHCNTDSLTVVFVLGESLRATSMQLNGYERPTNPYLVKEQNVVSLPNVHSEYGYTHESVPYILTRADRDHPNRAYEERSFISLLRQSGYRTTWLANQESVNTFVYFMNECDTLISVSNGKSLFIYSKWLDEDILPYYSQALASTTPRRFVLVHTIGSHWYYNNHYPERYQRWKPVTHSKVISSNSHDEMRNAYDNTILYSDYIWHQLINGLRREKAILVFLADHSENMGEDGHYTHGDGDWPAQHNPACFVWYSDSYAATYPEKIAALRRNSRRHYNDSFLFHTILDAADVVSEHLQTTESILR